MKLALKWGVAIVVIDAAIMIAAGATTSAAAVAVAVRVAAVVAAAVGMGTATDMVYRRSGSQSKISSTRVICIQTSSVTS